MRYLPIPIPGENSWEKLVDIGASAYKKEDDEQKRLEIEESRLQSMVSNTSIRRMRANMPF